MIASVASTRDGKRAQAHWAVRYIGAPWVLGADGPDAFDCWGLVRAVFRERAGVEIPAAGFASEDTRELIRGIASSPAWAGWNAADSPADLDAAVMAQARHPVHVGLWIDTDNGLRLLHTTRAGGCIVEDRRTLAAKGFRIVGTYRHDSRRTA